MRPNTTTTGHELRPRARRRIIRGRRLAAITALSPALLAPMLYVGHTATAAAKRCNGLEAEWVGTPERDHLFIGPDQIFVDGELIDHDGSVVVHTKGGDDIINVTASSGITVTACGGAGRDVFVVGANSTVPVQFYGGSGNDTIGGGAAADVLHGGKGDDSIKGGSGPDDLFGGRGDDVLSGDAGRDEFWGGPGNDACYGGTGWDVGTCESRYSVHPAGTPIPS